MGRLNVNKGGGPPTEAELARQLKIKVGVVKRCVRCVVRSCVFGGRGGRRWRKGVLGVWREARVCLDEMMGD